MLQPAGCAERRLSSAPRLRRIPFPQLWLRRLCPPPASELSLLRARRCIRSPGCLPEESSPPKQVARSGRAPGSWLRPLSSSPTGYGSEGEAALLAQVRRLQPPATPPPQRVCSGAVEASVGTLKLYPLPQIAELGAGGGLELAKKKKKAGRVRSPESLGRDSCASKGSGRPAAALRGGRGAELRARWASRESAPIPRGPGNSWALGREKKVWRRCLRESVKARPGRLQGISQTHPATPTRGCRFFGQLFLTSPGCILSMNANTLEEEH